LGDKILGKDLNCYAYEYYKCYSILFGKEIWAVVFSPYEKIIIDSALQSEDIVKRINENVEAKKFIRFDLWGEKKYKEFEGVVEENRFKVSRISRGRNSFKPIVIGKIVENINSRTIVVRLRMDIFVYIFMAYWLGFAGVAAAGATLTGISKGKFSSTTLIIYGMFLFGYLMMIISFNYESGKAKKYLENLFESKIR
jgi:hypothetical protein